MDSQPQAPTKAKITIDTPGNPQKVIDADDFIIVSISDKAMELTGRHNQSVSLLDPAYWNWKIGGVVRGIFAQQQKPGVTPGGLIVPR